MGFPLWTFESFVVSDFLDVVTYELDFQATDAIPLMLAVLWPLFPFEISLPSTSATSRPYIRPNYFRT